MQQNVLYLAVLPIMRLGPGIPRTEEVFTLYGSRELATQFFPDELERYIDGIWRLLQQMRGSHVISYDMERQDAGNGRLILQVTQNVQ